MTRIKQQSTRIGIDLQAIYIYVIRTGVLGLIIDKDYLEWNGLQINTSGSSQRNRVCFVGKIGENDRTCEIYPVACTTRAMICRNSNLFFFRRIHPCVMVMALIGLECRPGTCRNLNICRTLVLTTAICRNDNLQQKVRKYLNTERFERQYLTVGVRPFRIFLLVQQNAVTFVRKNGCVIIRNSEEVDANATQELPHTTL